MVRFCPQCKQQFDEDSGFCPFDGTPLEALSERLPSFSGVVISLKDAPSTTMALKRLEAAGRPDPYQKLVGTTLDARYRIERVLGEGGMGVVYLARHAVIDKLVAVKVLKRAAARDRNVVQRFMQEARAASRIGHPNIVDVTDFGTTPDGMVYSVMEYVEGDTLDHVLAAHAPLAPERALSIAAQIARALGAAHDKGIVHRDLKPDNIFVLDKDGHRDFVKIVDFGIAKIVDGSTAGPRLTRTGTIFGTPEYMAPEQAAGRSDIDHRVDIYSLGIILYQMIVGRVPHKGDHMMRTLAMQMLDPIEPPRAAQPGLAISDDLERVMLKALAKDREARFHSMAEFLLALDHGGGELGATSPATLASLASPVSPVTPDTPGVAEGHTRKAGGRVWLLPALLLLGAGGAAAALLLKGNSASDQTRPRAGADSQTELMQAHRADAMTPPPDAAMAMMVDAGAAASDAMSDAMMSDAMSDATPAEPARRRRVTSARRAGPRQPIDVQVMTIPGHARLYIDDDYSGQSGATIRKPEGAVAVVECRLDGYLPGRVKVRFNGDKVMYTCKLKRIKRCVEGIKNPFDDCPE